MLRFLLLLCTLLFAAAASDDRPRLRSNNHKNVKTYLRCHDEQYSCGDDNNGDHVNLCHFNGVEFTTLCVKSRSSIVEHLHPTDYCGPCMSSSTKKKAFETKEELQQAVDWYLTMDPTIQRTAHKSLAQEYGYPMGRWDVSRITDFKGLFARKVHFNEDLSGWQMQQATDLSYMFWHAHSFEGTGLEQWNVRNVTTMERTFFGAEEFQADLSSWKTDSLQNLMGTFWRATSFNSGVGEWNTSQVTIMSRCFSDAIAFNRDLSKWNVSQVLDTSFMFMNAVKFQQDLVKWNVENVATLERMFAKVPYYQTQSVQRNLLQQWNLRQEAVVTEMFTAPRDKSLRAQQLEANLQVDVQTLMRLAGKKPNATNTATNKDDEEEPDAAISREIYCHGGVCM